MTQRLAPCLFFVIVFMMEVTLQTLQDDIELQMNHTEKSLSRKRRYLVFPEGSSLQLVFCLTMPSLGMGQIFTIGSTAALAWELPHDPFEPFRKPSEVLHRIDKQPSKHTSGGWALQNTNSPVSYMKTYYNDFLINKPPVTGYSTINAHTRQTNRDNSRRKSSATKINNRNYNNRYEIPQYSKMSHNARSGTDRVYAAPVTSYIHPVYHKVYRRTRRDLYSKIEKLFTALSRDGKACLLKAICEVSKATHERGTFMEEIVKAIFRVRHDADQSDKEDDVYDFAANKQHNCTELYASCEHSIWNGMFSFT